MIDRFGTRGDLREVPVPSPGPNEVLVRETVAGVNPIDWKTRAGKGGDRAMPLVLGQDFAGRVERVGSGVTSFAAGDRVFGSARKHGAFGEFTMVSLDDPHLAFSTLPPDVSDEIGAALPTPALTALASLEILGTARGSTLAILGAVGALGSAAVQLATWGGTRVVAVAKRDQFDEARGYGAYDVVDADGDVAAAIRAVPGLSGGVDAVLDGVTVEQPHLEKWAAALRPGGALVSTVHAADPAWFAARGFTATNVVLMETPQSSKRGLDRLIEAIHAGHLRVDLGEQTTLEYVTSLLDRGERHELHGKALVHIS